MVVTIVYSTGATAISKLLMNNCVIEELLVVDDAIGVEGIRVILQSAVNNEACQAYIYIEEEYNQDSEVRTLLNNMRDRRRRMKTNVVGYLV